MNKILFIVIILFFAISCGKTRKNSDNSKLTENKIDLINQSLLVLNEFLASDSIEIYPILGKKLSKKFLEQCILNVDTFTDGFKENAILELNRIGSEKVRLYDRNISIKNFIIENEKSNFSVIYISNIIQSQYQNTKFCTFLFYWLEKGEFKGYYFYYEYFNSDDYQLQFFKEVQYIE